MVFDYRCEVQKLLVKFLLLLWREPMQEQSCPVKAGNF
jgi:hypothetical protein